MGVRDGDAHPRLVRDGQRSGWRHLKDGLVYNRATPALLAMMLLLGVGHVQSMGVGLLALLVAGFVQNVAMIAMTAILLAAAGGRFGLIFTVLIGIRWRTSIWRVTSSPAHARAVRAAGEASPDAAPDRLR